MTSSTSLLSVRMLLEIAVTVLALLVGGLTYRSVSAMLGFYRLRRRLMEIVPSPMKHHWLKGHIPVPKDHHRTFFEFTRILPRFHLRLLGIFPVVAVHHPDTISAALKHSPTKPAYIYDFMKAFIGEGLIASRGKRWSRDRRLLSKAFSLDMLRKYMPIYKSASTTLADKWLAKSNDVIDLEQDMMLVTFDIIMQCAMGCSSNCQQELNADSAIMRFLANAQWLSEATMTRYRNPFYHSDFIFFWLAPLGYEYKRRRREVTLFCEGVVERRRAELESSDVVSDDRTMLDAMLTVRDESGLGLSTSEIIDHVLTFLYAGHDTSSNTLHWLLYYLCRHQAIQSRCRDEIHDMLARCGGFGGLEHIHLNELTYLTQVINETLRLISPANGVVRLLEKDTKVDECTLPAGTCVEINIMGTHANPTLWDEPAKFNPDRFSPENCAKRHPNAFIPFAPGARSCIGKHVSMDEMRVILTTVLSRFRLRLADDTAPPPDWIVEVISKPKPGVKIKIEVI